MKHVEMIHCITGSRMLVPEDAVESYKAVGHAVVEEPKVETPKKATKKKSTKE